MAIDFRSDPTERRIKGWITRPHDPRPRLVPGWEPRPEFGVGQEEMLVPEAGVAYSPPQKPEPEPEAEPAPAPEPAPPYDWGAQRVAAFGNTPGAVYDQPQTSALSSGSSTPAPPNPPRPAAAPSVASPSARPASAPSPSAGSAGDPTSHTPPRRTTAQQSFVDTLLPQAQKVAQDTGIPWQVLMAIPANETGWGAAVFHNNYFGIKGPGAAARTWEVINGQRVDITDSFRTFDSAEQSMRAFASFLRENSRYAPALQYLKDNPSDWPGFVKQIHQAGYATDPAWSDKIASIGHALEGVRVENTQSPVVPTGSAVNAARSAVGTQKVWGGTSRAIPTASQQSQFGDPTLSEAEAYAACGPAAAVRFAQAYGRNPTLREAVDLAKEVGWTTRAGMAGIGSQQKLLANLGIPTKLVMGAQWGAFAQEAASGNPVTISTPGHYFYADGYDAQKGFHVGKSGTDLKGGSEWMTPQQMEARMGKVQGALFADSPTIAAPSSASEPDASYVVWALRNGQGVRLAPSVGALNTISQPISADQARPGDLVFFTDNDQQHVGLYSGGGMMLYDNGRAMEVPLIGGAEFRRLPAALIPAPRPAPRAPVPTAPRPTARVLQTRTAQTRKLGGGQEEANPTQALVDDPAARAQTLRDQGWTEDAIARVLEVPTQTVETIPSNVLGGYGRRPGASLGDTLVGIFVDDPAVGAQRSIDLYPGNIERFQATGGHMVGNRGGNVSPETVYEHEAHHAINDLQPDVRNRLYNRNFDAATVFADINTLRQYAATRGDAQLYDAANQALDAYQKDPAHINHWLYYTGALETAPEWYRKRYFDYLMATPDWQGVQEQSPPLDRRSPRLSGGAGQEGFTDGGGGGGIPDESDLLQGNRIVDNPPEQPTDFGALAGQIVDDWLAEPIRQEFQQATRTSAPRDVGEAMSQAAYDVTHRSYPSVGPGGLGLVDPRMVPPEAGPDDLDLNLPFGKKVADEEKPITSDVARISSAGDLPPAGSGLYGYAPNPQDKYIAQVTLPDGSPAKVIKNEHATGLTQYLYVDEQGNIVWKNFSGSQPSSAQAQQLLDNHLAGGGFINTPSGSSGAPSAAQQNAAQNAQVLGAATPPGTQYPNPQGFSGQLLEPFNAGPGHAYVGEFDDQHGNPIDIYRIDNPAGTGYVYQVVDITGGNGHGPIVHEVFASHKAGGSAIVDALNAGVHDMADMPGATHHMGQPFDPHSGSQSHQFWTPASGVNTPYIQGPNDREHLSFFDQNHKYIVVVKREKPDGTMDYLFVESASGTYTVKGIAWGTNPPTVEEAKKLYQNHVTNAAPPAAPPNTPTVGQPPPQWVNNSYSNWSFTDHAGNDIEVFHKWNSSTNQYDLVYVNKTSGLVDHISHSPNTYLNESQLKVAHHQANYPNVPVQIDPHQPGGPHGKPGWVPPGHDETAQMHLFSGLSDAEHKVTDALWKDLQGQIEGDELAQALGFPDEASIDPDQIGQYAIEQAEQGRPQFMWELPKVAVHQFSHMTDNVYQHLRYLMSLGEDGIHISHAYGSSDPVWQPGHLALGDDTGGHGEIHVAGRYTDTDAATAEDRMGGNTPARLYVMPEIPREQVVDLVNDPHAAQMIADAHDWADQVWQGRFDDWNRKLNDHYSDPNNVPHPGPQPSKTRLQREYLLDRGKVVVYGGGFSNERGEALWLKDPQEIGMLVAEGQARDVLSLMKRHSGWNPKLTVPGGMVIFAIAPWEAQQFQQQRQQIQQQAAGAGQEEAEEDPAPTMSKKEASYTKKAEDDFCGDCSMFRSGACTLVKGTINPRGSCDYFEPKQDMGSGQEGFTDGGGGGMAFNLALPDQEPDDNPFLRAADTTIRNWLFEGSQQQPSEPGMVERVQGRDIVGDVGNLLSSVGQTVQDVLPTQAQKDAAAALPPPAPPPRKPIAKTMPEDVTRPTQEPLTPTAPIETPSQPVTPEPAPAGPNADIGGPESNVQRMTRGQPVNPMELNTDIGRYAARQFIPQDTLKQGVQVPVIGPVTVEDVAAQILSPGALINTAAGPGTGIIGRVGQSVADEAVGLATQKAIGIAVPRLGRVVAPLVQAASQRLGPAVDALTDRLAPVIVKYAESPVGKFLLEEEGASAVEHSLAVARNTLIASQVGGIMGAAPDIGEAMSRSGTGRDDPDWWGKVVDDYVHGAKAGAVLGAGFSAAKPAASWALSKSVGPKVMHEFNAFFRPLNNLDDLVTREALATRANGIHLASARSRIAGLNARVYLGKPGEGLNTAEAAAYFETERTLVGFKGKNGETISAQGEQWIQRMAQYADDLGDTMRGMGILGPTQDVRTPVGQPGPSVHVMHLYDTTVKQAQAGEQRGGLGWKDTATHQRNKTINPNIDPNTPRTIREAIDEHIRDDLNNPKPLDNFSQRLEAAIYQSEKAIANRGFYDTIRPGKVKRPGQMMVHRDDPDKPADWRFYNEKWRFGRRAMDYAYHPDLADALDNLSYVHPAPTWLRNWGEYVAAPLKKGVFSGTPAHAFNISWRMLSTLHPLETADLIGNYIMPTMFHGGVGNLILNNQAKFERAAAAGVTFGSRAFADSISHEGGLTSRLSQFGWGGMTGAAAGWKMAKDRNETDEEALKQAWFGAMLGAAPAVPGTGRLIKVLGKDVPLQNAASWADVMHHAIFNEALPAAKLGMFDILTRANPRADVGEIATFVNRSMGGIDTLKLARSPWAQDLMRFSLIASDWTEGIVSQSVSLAMPSAQGSLTRWQMVKGLATFMGFVELLNKATTGHYTWDNPDGKEFQLEDTGIRNGLADAMGRPDLKATDTDGRQIRTTSDVVPPMRGAMEVIGEWAREAELTLGQVEYGLGDKEAGQRLITRASGDLTRGEVPPQPIHKTAEFIGNRIGPGLGFLGAAGEAIRHKQSDFMGKPLDKPTPDDPASWATFVSHVFAPSAPAMAQSTMQNVDLNRPYNQKWVDGLIEALGFTRTSYVKETSESIGAAERLKELGLGVSPEMQAHNEETYQRRRKELDAQEADLYAQLQAPGSDMSHAKFDEKRQEISHARRILTRRQEIKEDYASLAPEWARAGVQDFLMNVFNSNIGGSPRSADVPRELPLQDIYDQYWTPAGVNMSNEKQVKAAQLNMIREWALQHDQDPQAVEDMIKWRVQHQDLRSGSVPPVPTLPNVTSGDLANAADKFLESAEDPNDRSKLISDVEKRADAQRVYLKAEARRLGTTPEVLLARINLRLSDVKQLSPMEKSYNNALQTYFTSRDDDLHPRYLNPDGTPLGNQAMWDDWDLNIKNIGLSNALVNKEWRERATAQARGTAARERYLLTNENNTAFEQFFGSGRGMTETGWKDYVAGRLVGYSDLNRLSAKQPPKNETINRDKIQEWYRASSPQERQQVRVPIWINGQMRQLPLQAAAGYARRNMINTAGRTLATMAAHDDPNPNEAPTEESTVGADNG